MSSKVAENFILFKESVVLEKELVDSSIVMWFFVNL